MVFCDISYYLENYQSLESSTPRPRQSLTTTANLNSSPPVILATIKPNNSHAPFHASKLDTFVSHANEDEQAEAQAGQHPIGGNLTGSSSRFSKSMDQTTRDGMDLVRAHLFENSSTVSRNSEIGAASSEKFRLLKMGLSSSLSSHPALPKASVVEAKNSSATVIERPKHESEVVLSSVSSKTETSAPILPPQEQAPIMTNVLKKIVAEQMSDLAGTLRNDIHNMHLELIKQSMVQQQATADLLQKYLPITGKLMEEIERLKDENELLKLKLLSITK